MSVYAMGIMREAFTCIEYRPLIIPVGDSGRRVPFEGAGSQSGAFKPWIVKLNGDNDADDYRGSIDAGSLYVKI